MTFSRIFGIALCISILFLNIDADNPVSSSTVVDSSSSSFTSASSSSSSLLSTPPPSSSSTSYSHEFFCKVCGKTLFDTEDHITDTILSGPRLITAFHEPDLGPRGTLHTMLRSHTAGTIDVAVFRDTVGGGGSLSSSSPVVKLVGPSENPVFPGYIQHQTICGRCGQPIGWKFERLVTPSYGGSASTTSSSSSSSHSTNHQSSSSFSSTDGSSGSTTGSTVYQVIPYIEGEETVRLFPLEENCYSLPRGWWTYEVCTKRKIRQFHRDTDGSINPDWSLGDYDIQGKIERVRPLSPVTGYYSSQFYSHGQRCDETGKGRATEVQFFCCSSSHMVTTGPYIEDIEEPSLCRYRVKLCVPSLCMPVGSTPPPVSVGPSSVSSSHPSSSSSSSSSISSASSESSTVVPNIPNNHEETSTVSGTDNPRITKDTNRRETSTEEISSESSSSSSPIKTEKADTPPSATFPPFQPQAPETTYSPQGLPNSFMLASWNALIGSDSETYNHLKGNDYVTGIAPVRFQ